MSTASSSVAIVGAGVIGLATAVEMAQSGINVDVFDPAPASGATHHAGGMLAPAAEVVYQQDPLFPLMQASGKWYPELIAAVAKHSDLDTGYRDEGTLVVAADRADSQHLSELMDYQNAHGMQVERITVRQARSLEPGLSPRLASAVSIPGDTQVFPRQWALALYDAAENSGVRFHRTKVTHIDDGVDGGRVPTDEGTFAADQEVRAAGLGANGLSGWSQPLRPVRRPAPPGLRRRYLLRCVPFRRRLHRRCV